MKNVKKNWTTKCLSFDLDIYVDYVVEQCLEKIFNFVVKVLFDLFCLTMEMKIFVTVIYEYSVEV